jgi:hypothetical protein
VQIDDLEDRAQGDRHLGQGPAVDQLRHLRHQRLVGCDVQDLAVPADADAVAGEDLERHREQLAARQRLAGA